MIRTILKGIKKVLLMLGKEVFSWVNGFIITSADYRSYVFIRQKE